MNPKSRWEKNSYTAEFSAELEHIEPLWKEVEAKLVARGFLEKKIFAVQILIREALNNAICHGSKNNAEKTVRLEISIGAHEMFITVRDQGPGFDWRIHMHDEADPLLSSGRGVGLLKAYALQVAYNDRGNVLYLTLHT